MGTLAGLKYGSWLKVWGYTYKCIGYYQSNSKKTMVRLSLYQFDPSTGKMRSLRRYAITTLVDLINHDARIID